VYVVLRPATTYSLALCVRHAPHMLVRVRVILLYMISMPLNPLFLQCGLQEIALEMTASHWTGIFLLDIWNLTIWKGITKFTMSYVKDRKKEVNFLHKTNFYLSVSTYD
jgi:hypothetical protein